MHLAIDASNIRQGGGITHLSQLLSASAPGEAGFTQVTVWACRATLDQLPSQPWLDKVASAWTEAGLLYRTLGRQFFLGREMARRGCSVLFSPGGTVPLGLRVPVVTMSQNMLPFEPDEAVRFGRWSWMRLKMRLLRHAQGRAFRRADGVIFLTRYAQDRVLKAIGCRQRRSAIIPHGVEPRFSVGSRLHRDASEFSSQRPMTLLYVSILMPYKHQIEVATAMGDLRRKGYAIRGRFLGGDWGAYGAQFRDCLARLDPSGEYLEWPGGVPHEGLHREYEAADVFVFASSCENLPNILVEAMAAGLPIACSQRGPMPEVLGEAGIYFDPESPDSIAQSLRALIDDAALRRGLAASARKASHAYSWERCARETLGFIGSVASSRFEAKLQENN